MVESVLLVKAVDASCLQPSGYPLDRRSGRRLSQITGKRANCHCEADTPFCCAVKTWSAVQSTTVRASMDQGYLGGQVLSYDLMVDVLPRLDGKEVGYNP